MQAWMEAERSMRRPSCFLILSQRSSQPGKVEYLVPLGEGRGNQGITRLTLKIT